MSQKHYDEMTPVEARAEWIKDLRSGAYSQIGGRLHAAGGGYCCLGVACETYKRCGGRLREELVTDGEEMAYDGSAGLLPAVVAGWLGLCKNQYAARQSDEYAGECRESVMFQNVPLDSLVDLNDAGMSFAEIADLIEQDKIFTY